MLQLTKAGGDFLATEENIRKIPFRCVHSSWRRDWAFKCIYQLKAKGVSLRTGIQARWHTYVGRRTCTYLQRDKVRVWVCVREREEEGGGGGACIHPMLQQVRNDEEYRYQMCWRFKKGKEYIAKKKMINQFHYFFKSINATITSVLQIISL